MGKDIMSYSLLIPILFLMMMIPYGLYRELGDRKREIERLQKGLAARDRDLCLRDEIEKKQMEVIQNLTKEMGELNTSVEMWLEKEEASIDRM